MKKLWIAALSLCMLGALVGGLAACQKDTPDTAVSSAPTQAPMIENSHRLTQNNYGEAVCDHCGAALYEGTILYELSENEKYYSAQGGKDIGEELILPAYYKARGDTEYLPVLEATCFFSPHLKRAELSPVVEEVNFPRNNPIEELVVPENSLHFSTKDNVLFDKSGEKLTYYLPSKTNATYAVPHGVKEIWKSAFAYCTNIKSVYLPQSVERIRDFAFANCANLASVALPDSVKQIGESAFRSCTRLTSFTIPENLKIIEPNVFTGSGIVEIEIPAGVTELGPECFSYCAALTEVKIPEDTQIEKIGTYAFGSCTSLSSFTLPDRVTELLYNTFNGCTSLETVNVSAKSRLQKIGPYCFTDCTALTTFKIPPSVVEIDDEAFQHCTGIKSIVIPRTVQIMGYGVFSGWKQGQTIYVYFKENELPEGWEYDWVPHYGTNVVYEYTGV